MVQRAFVQAMQHGVLAAALAGCCFGGNATGPNPLLPGTTPPTIPGVAPPTMPMGAPVTIGPGFLPDPQTTTGTSGGPVMAQNMRADCRGYIAAGPNHILNATGQFANLRIIVSSQTDTTLVVQRADGSLECNDDSDGLNPVVQGPFGPGQHRIWVGSYSQTETGRPYTIGFTELPTVTAASIGGAGIPQECGMAVPTYGSLVVGSSVTLGMHTPWSGADGRGGTAVADVNWTAEMAPFVGQRTTITELGGLDNSGCPGARVAADNGQYFWRIRNMTF
jgi:hypothetical protein